MSDIDDIWGLSDGGNAKDTGTDYEVPGGGNMEAIPEGSKVLAMVENAEWKEKDNAEFLSIQWTAIKPEGVKNRKVFQKLFISDMDPSVTDQEKAKKKRDRARRMFAAIDANAGGKLAKKGGKPSAEDVLLALANKPMVIRLGVYSLPDRDNPNQNITGNWVQAVSDKTTETVITDAPLPKAQERQQSSYGGGAGRNSLDDDIPFAPEWR